MDDRTAEWRSILSIVIYRHELWRSLAFTFAYRRHMKRSDSTLVRDRFRGESCWDPIPESGQVVKAWAGSWGVNEGVILVFDRDR